MRTGTAIALSLLLLLTGQAWAADASRQYFGLSGSDAQFDPASGQTEDAGNVNAKLGYFVNPYVSVELHMGMTVTTESSSVDDPGLGYVAPMLRLNLPYEQVNVYSLFGIASVRGKFPGNYDDNYSDVAFGVGMELYGTRNTALTLEYMRYGVDDTYKTFGLGIVHYFDWPRVYNPRVSDR